MPWLHQTQIVHAAGNYSDHAMERKAQLLPRFLASAGRQADKTFLMRSAATATHTNTMARPLQGAVAPIVGGVVAPVRYWLHFIPTPYASTHFVHGLEVVSASNSPCSWSGYNYLGSHPLV